MGTKSTYLSQVDYGQAGNAVGLPNGLGSMNDYIYGTQMSRYYLIGGESGSGKTTIGDWAFILAPYAAIRTDPEFQQFKMSVNYFSLEQSPRTKQGKWASHLIHNKHGIWIPPALALGKTKSRLTEDQYKYCVEANDDLGELLDCIEFTENIGPSGFLSYLIRYGTKKGKWILAPVLNEKGEQVYSKDKKPLKERVGWTPNDPNERHIFMMDHISYAAQEKRTLKENIDYISRVCVKFRELTNSWTFVILQQFNTDLSSIERQKYKKAALTPQRGDFGDSKYTFQDADVVFGTLNPFKYDIMDDFQEFENIQRFNGLAVWLFLLKNRHDGPADTAIPYFMDPIGLTINEMPDPSEFKVRVEMGLLEDPLLAFEEKSQEILQLTKQYI